MSEFLRTYRNVPHTGTNRTPAEIIFGRLCVLTSSQWSCQTWEKDEGQAPPLQGTPVLAFKEGDGVWIRDFGRSTLSKWTPGIVQTPLGALMYMAVLPNGHNRKVHLDHFR